MLRLLQNQAGGILQSQFADMGYPSYGKKWRAGEDETEHAYFIVVFINF
jgi:hypothetical protein